MRGALVPSARAIDLEEESMRRIQRRPLGIALAAMLAISCFYLLSSNMCLWRCQAALFAISWVIFSSFKVWVDAGMCHLSCLVYDIKQQTAR